MIGRIVERGGKKARRRGRRTNGEERGDVGKREEVRKIEQEREKRREKGRAEKKNGMQQLGKTSINVFFSCSR